MCQLLHNTQFSQSDFNLSERLTRRICRLNDCSDGKFQRLLGRLFYNFGHRLRYLNECFPYFFFFFFFYFICYSKVQQLQQLQQLQLLSQSIHAQTYYTPKHTCNSTITHKVMPTVIYKCYSKKKKLIIFSKEEKLPRLQSPFVH